MAVTDTVVAYHAYVNHELLATRRAPSGIAPLLQELELRRPSVVTKRMLAEVIDASGWKKSVRDAADRLVREGWLLPLRSREAWEFVPASRAAAIPSGDPWIELRALLAQKPGTPVAVAFASAVWELGFSTHRPDRETFAHAPGWRPPSSLDLMRAVSYEWVLPTWDKEGLPVWHPATTVVAAATRPSSQDDWSNADTWLPETLRATTPEDILAEAEGRGTAALSRLAYFAEWSGREDVAQRLRPMLPDDLPVAYLGPRQPRGRWVKRWRLYDSLLPER